MVSVWLVPGMVLAALGGAAALALVTASIVDALRRHHRLHGSGPRGGRA